MNEISARLGLVALLTLLPACESVAPVRRAAAPPEPTDDSLIAFSTQSRRDLRAKNPMPRVAVVPASGGSATRLRKGSNPAWSPDGDKLVFTCHPGICTMDPDGSNVARITNPKGHVQDEGPSWGPNGTIAFTRTYLDFDRGPDIFVVPEEGGKARLLLEKGSNFSPAWSPDGASIAFIRGLGPQLEAPRTGFQLWTMAADGSDLQQLTTTGASRPAWSPDGELIAFDQAEAIWTIPAAGGTPRKLAPATTGRSIEGLGSSPTWSPDGTLIAYTCQTGEFDDNDLCVMNADGTGRTTILDTPANEASPVWQPSGEATPALPTPPASLRAELPRHMRFYLGDDLVLLFRRGDKYHSFHEGLLPHSCPVLLDEPDTYEEILERHRGCIGTALHRIVPVDGPVPSTEKGSHDLELPQLRSSDELIWRGEPPSGYIGIDSSGACARIARFAPDYVCRDGEIVLVAKRA